MSGQRNPRDGRDIEEERRRGRELQSRLPKPRFRRRPRSGRAESTADVVDAGCCLSDLAELAAWAAVLTTATAALVRARRHHRLRPRS